MPLFSAATYVCDVHDAGAHRVLHLVRLLSVRGHQSRVSLRMRANCCLYDSFW